MSMVLKIGRLFASWPGWLCEGISCSFFFFILLSYRLDGYGYGSTISTIEKVR